MIPKLQEFSAGYNIIELATFPQDVGRPRINADLHHSLQQEDPQGGHDDSPPVLFRYQPDESHFRVEPSREVPLDHIELPNQMVDGMETGTVPDILDYLVAKPRHAVRLNRLDTLGETNVN